MTLAFIDHSSLKTIPLLIFKFILHISPFIFSL